MRTRVRVLALVGVLVGSRARNRARRLAAHAVSRPHLQGRHHAARSRSRPRARSTGISAAPSRSWEPGRSASKGSSSTRPASSSRTTRRRSTSRLPTSSTAARWPSWATSSSRRRGTGTSTGCGPSSPAASACCTRPRRQPTALDVLPVEAKLLGYNVGGGAVGFLTERTGLRFDLRYFSNLKPTDDTGRSPSDASI